MYLTDQEISARLDEFDFVAEPGSDSFDPGSQIGPCSVDLRLSSSYWKPEAPRPWRFGRALAIDLTRGRIMEANPSRGWRRVLARRTDYLTLKPGQLILARTCESFKVPSDCAASIEGRSSFARLGLSVHASGSFINPGYAGQMPLTLINHSPFTLRVPVGLSLCQVMFIPLSGAPKLDYAGRHPKYLPDIGGPSYWWRDLAVKNLHRRLSESRYDDSAVDHVIDFFTFNTHAYSVYERMEAFLGQSAHYGTSDDLLDAFAAKETRRFRVARAAILSARTAFLAALGVGLPYLLYESDRSAIGTSLTGVAVLASFVAAVWGWWQRTPEYLTAERLRALRQQQTAVTG